MKKIQFLCALIIGKIVCALVNIIDKDSNIIHKRDLLNKDQLYIYHISKDSLGNMWMSTKENIVVYNYNID